MTVPWLADSTTINESRLFNYTARKMRLSLQIASVYLPRLPVTGAVPLKPSGTSVPQIPCAHPTFKPWLRYWEFPSRGGNRSVGHGSNGSPFLDGSRGSWITASNPLTHDDEITAQ